MRRKRLLFVSKDFGAASVMILLAKAARDEGFNIRIIAEGPAAEQCEKSGLHVFIKYPLNFNSSNISIHVRKIMDDFKLDILITTLSTPIHIEELFGLCANQYNVPVVFLEDF